MPKLRRPLGRPPVVPKHAAEPLSALDRAVALAVLPRSFDQLVAKTLVIPLVMVVLDILRDAPAKINITNCSGSRSIGAA